VVFSREGDLHRWAEISVIWMILPIMVLGLLFLGLNVGVILVLNHFIRILPRYTGRAHLGMLQAERQARGWSDRVVNPVLQLESFRASVGRIPELLRRKRNHQR
jgi:hypothetical protein